MLFANGRWITYVIGSALLIEYTTSCVRTAQEPSPTFPAPPPPVDTGVNQEAPTSFIVETSPPATCSPADPAISAGVIIVTTPPDEQGNLQVEIQSDESRQVGACSCDNGAKQAFFATLDSPSLDPHGENPYGNVVDVHCRDPASFCVCNHGGECFKQMDSKETLKLQLYPYCDGGGCFMYTVPLCSSNVTGLVSTKDAAQTYGCANVFDGGDLMMLGSNSTFIRAFAVSCKGCEAIKDLRQSSCRAPFTKSSCMLPGPQDAAALVIDIPDAHQRRHLLNPVVGSCPCGEGLAKSFFTSQSSNNPARIDKPTVVVRCNDMSKLCVCDEEDRCYHPIGNSLDEVQLHSYCKDDECHFYTNPICSEDSGESGLTSANGTVTFLCSDSKEQHFGTNSTYIKAHSVSCGGCEKIRTAGPTSCNGPQTQKDGERSARMVTNKHQVEFIRRVLRTA